MTTAALEAPAPGTSPGCGDLATPLHRSLDQFALAEVERLSADEQAALLRSLARAEARIAALRLRVLATADRSRTAASAGAASTGQWAAGITHLDQADAHRQVGLATGLRTRPATEDALSAGAISPAHAAVILQADQHLPPRIGAEQRAAVEGALLEQAQRMAPGALRRAARRALAAVEPDERVVDAHEDGLVADEEAVARARTRLSLHDNDDGTVTGHFTIPTAQGHLLRKILQTITAPRRGRLGASQAQVGEREARTDWDRARGAAFCELLEHLPTDHLRPRTAATLVVTIDERTLRGALKVAHLDTGAALSAGEARRLACTSALLPAVLGGASVPLDLGHSARLFSEAQRTALGITHATCAADGCERPFAWCELHHRQPWAHGGRTDLAEAVPLCHFHHQRIHDDLYEHGRGPDGSIIFHRRT